MLYHTWLHYFAPDIAYKYSPFIYAAGIQSMAVRLNLLTLLTITIYDQNNVEE